MILLRIVLKELNFICMMKKELSLILKDTIKFWKEPELTECFDAQVIGLLKYTNFKELFQDFPIELLADKSMTKDELLNVLEEFYPIEKQNEFGILGIKIEK